MLSPSSSFILLTLTQTHYAAGVLGTLEQFGLGGLAEILELVDGVHVIWNLLSLQRDLHSKFDNLDLWFEGTGRVRHSETSHIR